MGNSHTGDGRPTQMIVRNEERGSELAENADLVSNGHQVWPCRGLDLADDLKPTLLHQQRLPKPSALSGSGGRTLVPGKGPIRSRRVHGPLW